MPDPERMTPLEWRASTSLASIYALRILGLFLILPVFAIHARGIPGGDSAVLVGLAIGIYGLTQGLLQIPFGMASDRIGRKPIIVGGLSVFALGSFVSAAAPTIGWIIAGRALQGAGAVSAAVTAMIADATRDSQRTKAMAMVGGSVGVSFALSLVLAPLLYRHIGMGGLFAIIGVLALGAMALVAWVTPAVPVPKAAQPVSFKQVLADAELMRLNLGIFVLHLAQMAMFVVVPGLLVERVGLALADHWQVYLPAVALSFVLMVPALMSAERRGRAKRVYLASIVTMLAVQLVFGLFVSVVQPTAWSVGVLLLVFFVAFNILEAQLPSFVSRVAPAAAKGAALGVYNTVQALGLFVGGVAGGWVVSHFGPTAVFGMCAGSMALWWLAASSMAVPKRREAAVPA